MGRGAETKARRQIAKARAKAEGRDWKRGSTAQRGHGQADGQGASGDGQGGDGQGMGGHGNQGYYGSGAPGGAGGLGGVDGKPASTLTWVRHSAIMCTAKEVFCDMHKLWRIGKARTVLE